MRTSDMFPEHEILENENYYAITLALDTSGQIETGGQTEWVGFAEDNHRIELRKLSLVRAFSIANYWKDFYQPYIVVNNDHDFYRWFLGGGHALITSGMIEAHLPWALEVHECVQQGFCDGFTSVNKLPKGAFNRAPTPKVRMQVIKRDGYRCKICGRRPADYVDVEIHVHHIRPYANNGLSTGPNLVSLCNTCHKGLDPHYEVNLFSLIDPNWGESCNELKSRSLADYFNGIKNYRKTIALKLSAHETEKID